VTTVGHSLTGLSIATLVLPRGRSIAWYLIVGQFCIFFANLPDFPLPGWGHGNYHVSHSLFVTLFLIGVLALPLRWLPRRKHPAESVLAAWSLAWLSHLVLDSMYAHGRGIGIFWPLSEAHLALPVPWFQTVSLPPFTGHNLRVFAIEALAYGGLLATCIVARRLMLQRPH
jgi:membrane-bound metal-dependent hydrolase YbcI (DUF457 family)